MIQDEEIRALIVDFIAEDVSLADFVRSLESNSWSMFSDGSSQSAVEKVASASLLVSEFYDRIISEREFKSELASLVKNVVIEYKD